MKIRPPRRIVAARNRPKQAKSKGSEMSEQGPRVGLFVTCLVDLFRPSVGFAAVKLLEQAGCTVEVPRAQTCCGQPAYNSGDRADAQAIAAQVIAAFAGFKYVVAPSGSCAANRPWGVRPSAPAAASVRYRAVRIVRRTNPMVESGFLWHRPHDNETVDRPTPFSAMSVRTGTSNQLIPLSQDPLDRKQGEGEEEGTPIIPGVL